MGSSCLYSKHSHLLGPLPSSISNVYKIEMIMSLTFLYTFLCSWGWRKIVFFKFTNNCLHYYGVQEKFKINLMIDLKSMYILDSVVLVISLFKPMLVRYCLQFTIQFIFFQKNTVCMCVDMYMCVCVYVVCVYVCGGYVGVSVCG